MGDVNGYKLSRKTRVQVGSAKASNSGNGGTRRSNSRSESKPKSLLSSRRRVEATEETERNRKDRLGSADAKRKRVYGGDGDFEGKRRVRGEIGDGFAEERGRKKEFDERSKAKRGMSAAVRREVRERRMGGVDGADDVRLRTRVAAERRVAGKLGKSEKRIGKEANLDKQSVKGERNKRQGGALEGFNNKKKDKKDEEEMANDPPKKRKRIKIDPYDVSNKRMDDGISMDGKKMEKKVEDEKITELSNNAQFRAIQPSPSILSFVEDNLLGRRRLIELRRAGYNVDLSAPLDNIPFSTSSERERCEESVFRNKLSFFAAANVSSSFPPADLPEIAFAGRSNVGKSSLLNALTRQWGVVRTSDKPGFTQTINFFKLGSKLCLVDLPGYGFAYAKEEVKDAWEELVKEYVSTRVGLKRVCLLIDTKWGMKPRDHELVHLMERSQTKYQIVLTKTDMVFPIDVARRAMEIEENLKGNKSVVNPLMMISSKSGAGIRSLRSVLAKISRFAKP